MSKDKKFRYDLYETIFDLFNLCSNCKKKCIGEKLRRFLRNANVVIAGGSVVYALNSFVPLLSVGDVDIFINNKTTFIKIIEKCIELFGGDYEWKNYHGYGDYDKKGNGFFCEETYATKMTTISVITIKPFGRECYTNHFELQFIYFNWETPYDVINNFHYDYVQCALYKKQLYITDNCVIAHKNKEIRICNEIPKKMWSTLNKANMKNFKSPLFGPDINSAYFCDFVKCEKNKTIKNQSPNIDFSTLKLKLNPIKYSNKTKIILKDVIVKKAIQYEKSDNYAKNAWNIVLFQHTLNYKTKCFSENISISHDSLLKYFNGYYYMQPRTHETIRILSESSEILSNSGDVYVIKLKYIPYKNNFMCEIEKKKKKIHVYGYIVLFQIVTEKNIIGCNFSPNFKLKTINSSPPELSLNEYVKSKKRKIYNICDINRLLSNINISVPLIDLISFERT